MSETKIVQFAEDSVILSQGSTNQEMYKILTGKVALYMNYGEDDEYLVEILSEQRCFGEMAILCGHPSLYTVVAYNTVLLMRISQEDFDDFIKNNYKNAIDIMKHLATSLMTLNFNLNMTIEELFQNNKMDQGDVTKISNMIRQYASTDPHGLRFMDKKI